jgi:hypothetical protein
MSNSDLVTRPTNPDALVLEAWGQGMMVGALVVMSAITVANMRKRVLLHKLILTEVLGFPLGSKSVLRYLTLF